ncbi:hypothetical protein Hanom_Chr06g00510851 [Helianthus anomalus]
MTKIPFPLKGQTIGTIRASSSFLEKNPTTTLHLQPPPTITLLSATTLENKLHGLPPHKRFNLIHQQKPNIHPQDFIFPASSCLPAKKRKKPVTHLRFRPILTPLQPPAPPPAYPPKKEYAPYTQIFSWTNPFHHLT